MSRKRSRQDSEYQDEMDQRETKICAKCKCIISATGATVRRNELHPVDTVLPTKDSPNAWCSACQRKERQRQPKPYADMYSVSSRGSSLFSSHTSQNHQGHSYVSQQRLPSFSSMGFRAYSGRAASRTDAESGQATSYADSGTASYTSSHGPSCTDSCMGSYTDSGVRSFTDAGVAS